MEKGKRLRQEGGGEKLGERKGCVSWASIIISGPFGGGVKTVKRIVQRRTELEKRGELGPRKRWEGEKVLTRVARGVVATMRNYCKDVKWTLKTKNQRGGEGMSKKGKNRLLKYNQEGPPREGTERKYCPSRIVPFGGLREKGGEGLRGGP